MYYKRSFAKIKIPGSRLFTGFRGCFHGRGRKNRTLNTRFWRPLLYQLSYTPVIWGDRWGSNPRMLEPQSSVLTTSPRPPYCNRQLPILPGRLQPSTFGVYVLNYCVRNGNRWDHIAIITGYSIEGLYLQNYTETRIILVSAF